jgi:minor histocompatibility antigen H13
LRQIANACDLLSVLQDAMRFPLLGSAVLLSLFIAFKFLPKVWINALLTAYIGTVAILVLVGTMQPYFTNFFPEWMRHKSLTLPPFKIPFLVDASEPTTLTLPQIVFGFISTAFCIW